MALCSILVLWASQEGYSNFVVEIFLVCVWEQSYVFSICISNSAKPLLSAYSDAVKISPALKISFPWGSRAVGTAVAGTLCTPALIQRLGPGQATPLPCTLAAHSREGSWQGDVALREIWGM